MRIVAYAWIKGEILNLSYIGPRLSMLEGVAGQVAIVGDKRRVRSSDEAVVGRRPSDTVNISTQNISAKFGLVEQHDALRAYFFKRLRSPQDVEDYIQDVYARVLASAQPARPTRIWRAIVMKAAASVLIDRFRHDQARRRNLHSALDEAGDPGDDGVGSPERALIARQRWASLQKTLDELDPLCRKVFLMARMEQLSHKEIARRSGLTPAQVGRQIEKAMYHLAKTMAETL